MKNSKKHHNKLLSLAKYNSLLIPEQRQFLYDNGQENFDCIKNMLQEGEFRKTNHICGAVRLLYMLRGFDRNDDFIKIATELINDENIQIRSYCFNLLVVLTAENFREITDEFDKGDINEKIIPILRIALKQGVSIDSAELVKKLLVRNWAKGA